MARQEILFHADAGREQGWGHLRECLSVATALKSRGLAPKFLLPTGCGEAEKQAQQEGYEVLTLAPELWRAEAPPPAELSAAMDGRFLVTNLVQVSGGYAREAAKAVKGWAIITEHAEQELAPLSFNICREPRYMPLHESYRGKPAPRLRENVRELFVCFGGADPKNVCGLTLEMLRQGFERGTLTRDLRATVVLGPIFDHSAAVRALQATYPIPLDIVGPVSPEELARLAQAADLTITTGGGTMYEFAALGLPSVVVPILDKMDANAKVLAASGAVAKTERADRVCAEDLIAAVRGLLNLPARKAMSAAAQAAVDGRGAERITARLIEEWRLS